MEYPEYLSIAEMQRWVLDTDIDWDSISKEKALSQPDLLERVRSSALIESFFPIFTSRIMELLWNDVNATAIYSIQLYESYRHFHVFNRYLEQVEYRPLTEDDIVAVREKNVDLHYTNAIEVLTRYFMSEHFAAYHFFKDSRKAADPVLASILNFVARDEIRHAQFSYDLIQTRVTANPDLYEEVIQAADNFVHIGMYVVEEIPVAEPNDFVSIMTMRKKLERLKPKLSRSNG